ncbi:hypothetical protein ACIHIX_25005 [Streptomyces sp. NPDC051913]|uniref:hypothetical protein n=1 Tax=Streptomyces sp. NPDC051913 TaxID=3365676 RepID=UPI0037D421B0
MNAARARGRMLALFSLAYSDPERSIAFGYEAMLRQGRRRVRGQPSGSRPAWTTLTTREASGLV